MKFLKVLLIILLVIAGLLLVIPVFLPGKTTVSTSNKINLPPELVFHETAMFSERAEWDPWLKMEPGAKVDILPRPGYVGSVYSWNGERIGHGKMRVDSVHFPDYIASSIWFGDNPEPSLVEWLLNEQDSSTKVSWQFTSEGSYPFGRIMLLFMKRALGSSFSSGLADYKLFLEADPPRMYELSEISIERSYDTYALVIPASGTIEEIAAQMQIKFPMLTEMVQEQALEPNGPPFAHFLDFNAETGFAHALLAIPVKQEGVTSGDVRPAYYKAIDAVAVTHSGKYEFLPESYKTLSEYAAANNLEVTGEAFEVYLSGMESPNPMDWKTMIAYPLKN